MTVYYNRTLGWYTKDHKTAMNWFRQGMDVITCNTKAHQIYRWKTRTFTKTS